MPDSEPVLSPEEIAALLSGEQATTDANASLPQTRPASSRRGSHPSAASSSSGAISQAAFRPEAPGWMALEALLENAGREFAAGLTPLLREPLECQAGSLEETSPAREAGQGRLAAGAICPGHAAGSLVLSFDTAVLAPLLGRMLGSREPVHLSPERGLTPIEQRLVGRIATLYFATLQRMASELWVCELDRVGNETTLSGELSPRCLRMRYQIPTGATRGWFQVSLSAELARELAGRLLAKNGPAEPAPAAEAILKPQHSSTGPVVTASLPTVDLPLFGEIRLEVGDVIDTELPADGNVVIAIDGVPHCEGTPAQWEGRLAVELNGPPSDES